MDALERLQEELADDAFAGALRIVVREGMARAESAYGHKDIEISWSGTQHESALDNIQAPQPITNRSLVFRTGDSLVVCRAPKKTQAELIEQRVCSELAINVLDGAVALGRNVLVAGPWAGGVELIHALVGAGKAPALVSGQGLAVPAGWASVRSVEDANAVGADRLAMWSGSTEAVLRACLKSCGLVAWQEARSIDKALMRLECARGWEEASGAPLRILAAIDLVVELSPVSPSRVDAIYELHMTGDGYRPVRLFARGQGATPEALMPLGAPRFVRWLHDVGHELAVADLERALSQSAPTAPHEPEEHQPEPPAPEPEVIQAPVPPSPQPPLPLEAIRTPARNPLLENAPPPGWELDQMSDDVVEGEAREGGENDAYMAATFGLEPPPAPPGGGGAPPADFAEALRRARDRDAEQSGVDDE